ncbi:tyrosine-tRNA ligase [Aureococcus anophagefferens]|nr:tyrosine-tRNA ligase [Aureococcus anophagefferens]
MHIAQGVYKAMNVNKCGGGGTFVFWVADWFALMNDKMGGDLAKIKDVGEYLVEVWRAAGMVMDRVEFRWASDDITSSADKYWPQMLDMARRFTVARVKKCCTIMGRAEGTLTAAQILYPLMQCTDVFFLRADICQLGVDQRKVNMLARDYCDAANLKFKPIILSHHMLYGLAGGEDDSSEDVRRKLTNAYCPRTVDDSLKHDGEMQLTKDELKNPCLDYVRHIVFCRPGATMAVGGATYDTAQAVCDAFLDGAISENALKESLGVAAFHRRFFGAVCGLADLFSPGVSTRLGLAVQSAAILARPSEYWIEVINAGRLFKLDEVQAHVGQSGDDMGARRRRGGRRQRRLLVDDGADCAKRKLKKAFCEPENVAFNPPLDLAKFLVAAKLLPALEIKRSPENGGDKAYAQRFSR